METEGYAVSSYFFYIEPTTTNEYDRKLFTCHTMFYMNFQEKRPFTLFGKSKAVAVEVFQNSYRMDRNPSPVMPTNLNSAQMKWVTGFHSWFFFKVHQVKSGFLCLTLCSLELFTWVMKVKAVLTWNLKDSKLIAWNPSPKMMRAAE